MKRAIIAILASMFVFSAAYAAGDAAATTMSKEDCDKAMSACQDQACKDELATKGCKAEEAKQ